MTAPAATPPAHTCQRCRRPATRELWWCGRSGTAACEHLCGVERHLEWAMADVARRPGSEIISVEPK